MAKKKNSLNSDGDEFLQFYVKDFTKYPKRPNAIIKRLCEEYFYDLEEKGREFLLIFHGWIMHKYKDSATANIQHYLLKKRMDEIYDVVATENSWEIPF